MTAEKITAFTELLKNDGFCEEISSLTEEKEIIPVAKKYGLNISEEEITELFTIKPDTRKWAEELKACSDKIEEVIKDPEKAEQFSAINSEEQFKNFCRENAIPENEHFVDMLYVVSSAKTGKIELSAEELDSVVGGSFWSTFKTITGFVPFVGTLAKFIMDLSDGSLRGTNNIMARLGVVLVVAAFDTVSTIATGGLLSLARGMIQSGLASVGKRALIYGALNVLSTGSGTAVTEIDNI